MGQLIPNDDSFGLGGRKLVGDVARLPACTRFHWFSTIVPGRGRTIIDPTQHAI